MTDERIIAYLLKELPETELERFEEECFDQESWPIQIDTVEEALIDDYLRNELTQERRQRFEGNYLTTEARQERVRMAAALLRRMDEYNADSKTIVAAWSSEPTWTDRFRVFWNHQSPALRAGMALVVVVIIAGALWLFLSRPPQTFATVTLNASKGNRAEGVQPVKVKLPLEADALRIVLTLPNQSGAADRYRVELEKDSGETKILKTAGQNSQSVIIEIPAAQLTRGQFALKLYAVKKDGSEQRVEGSYFFNVE